MTRRARASTLAILSLSSLASGQRITAIDAAPIGGGRADPEDINSSGQVVGAYLRQDGVRRAFLWSRSGIRDIESDPSAESIAFALNDAGVVVGQTTDAAGDTIAFRWVSPGPMERLTIFDGAGGREGVATDVNGSGTIVGYAHRPSIFGLVDRGFRLDPGATRGIQLPTLGGPTGHAFGINEAGEIVGQADNAGLSVKAALWSAAPLPVPLQLEATVSGANDVDDLGSVVGFRSTTSLVPTLWRTSNGQVLRLHLGLLPGHVHGIPLSIRRRASAADSLEVVGWSADGAGESRAVRWTVDASGSPSIEDLNRFVPPGSGWFLNRATGINARGEITGSGTLNGQPRGFVLDPAAPPAGRPALRFFHGLMASLLYLGPQQKTVWPTVFSEDVRALGLACPQDVHPRKEILLSAALGLVEVYGGLRDFLDGEEARGAITWLPYTYDWRQAWDDIVRDGTVYNADCFERQGQCFVPGCDACDACERPADTVKGFANQVWIVTHSNGGLLAKALLGERDPALGGLPPEVAARVAGLVMVACPQFGTPKALSVLLHGREYAKLFVTNAALREAAHRMPGAYQLLPTERYFERVASPVIEFVPRGFGLEIDQWSARYGRAIDGFGAMREFLLGTDGPRRDLAPPTRDEFCRWPARLDADTFARSSAVHADIAADFDRQLPVPVVQVVGWGLRTIRGLEYRSLQLSSSGTPPRGGFYRDLYTCDGDGTVVVPSAAALPGVPTYYLNLREHNRQQGKNRDHGSLMNVEALHELLRRILAGSPIEGIPFVGTSKPSVPCKDGYLITRSPAEIHVFQDGRHTGPVEVADGGFPVIQEDIPNSQYHSLGEGREALVEDFGTYLTSIEATGTGTVTLEGGRFEDDLRLEVFSVPDVPVRAATRIEFIFDPSADTAPPMTLDVEGDGTPEFVLSAGVGPDPRVYLAVTRAALDDLVDHTRAVGLPDSIERNLTKDLADAREDLARAGEELDRDRADKARKELEHALKELRQSYDERLAREISHGKVPDMARALLEESADVAGVLQAAIARVRD